MTPQRSRMARTIPANEQHFYQPLYILYVPGLIKKIIKGGLKLPCQKDKKMTDLIVRNLSTGSYGLSRSLVAKKKRKSA